MTAKLVTSTGLVEIDLSKYKNLQAVWHNAEIERAKPLVSVNVPPESNEGGKFNFDILSPFDFFKKTSR